MMRVRTLHTTILLALLLLLSAAQYPEPVGYVNDFAGVLSTRQRESLEARLRAYERETTVEVAVAIVASLEGESVEDYARGLFRAWGVGKARKNNGVLVLVAPSERRVRIQTGYGLESQLTNSEAQAITREAMVPRFRENDYAGGTIAGAEAVIEALRVMPQSLAAADAPDTAKADTKMDTATGCTEPESIMHNGHCYFPIKMDLAFDAAKTACMGKGAYLAMITT
ncbi:MAG: TPM domain-containing protein, partial [Gemmatimonadetes bacterium]|nr:TPM domain-containing protein [Gemmatimonadota bacterium]